MAHPADLRLTYDDLLALPDDGLRHELIAGEHFVTAAPFTKHQRALLKLARVLAELVERQDLGEVLIAPVDVVLSPRDVVEPDLLFVSKERAALITERNVPGAPDLAVEVLSPSTRRLDLRLKLDLYERFGVREYWIVDPDRETVTIHRHTGDGFTAPAELSAAAGDHLASPLFPGLHTPLAAIF